MIQQYQLSCQKQEYKNVEGSNGNETCKRNTARDGFRKSRSPGRKFFYQKIFTNVVCRVRLLNLWWTGCGT